MSHLLNVTVITIIKGVFGAGEFNLGPTPFSGWKLLFALWSLFNC